MSGTVSSCLSALDSIQELMHTNLIILDAKWITAIIYVILWVASYIADVVLFHRGLRATSKGLALTDSLIAELLLTDKLYTRVTTWSYSSNVAICIVK